MTEKLNKAKRRLSDFDFSGDGAHVALCSKTINGGAANGYTSVLIKSVKGLGDEGTTAVDILKDVTVTLSFQDFLKKFFHMWYEDAEILARALGFESEEGFDEWEEFIEGKVSQINIMKEANKSKDAGEFLSEKMTVVQAAEVLKLQSQLEQYKGFVDYAIDKKYQPKSKADNNENVNKGENMPNEKVEIEKSKLEELEKALEKNKAQEAEIVELKKAKEEKDKGEIKDLVKTFSFIEEGDVEGVVSVLHKARDIEGAEKILETLTKANKAIGEFVEKEHGVDADGNDNEVEGYQASVIKNLNLNKGE